MISEIVVNKGSSTELEFVVCVKVGLLWNPVDLNDLFELVWSNSKDVCFFPRSIEVDDICIDVTVVVGSIETPKGEDMSLTCLVLDISNSW